MEDGLSSNAPGSFQDMALQQKTAVSLLCKNGS